MGEAGIELKVGLEILAVRSLVMLSERKIFCNVTIIWINIETMSKLLQKKKNKCLEGSGGCCVKISLIAADWMSQHHFQVDD